MNKITVIIPTYNNVNGLNYLLNYFKNKPYKIVVVDNNVKIKKLTSLQVNEFKNLVYFQQEKNLGFAKAINLGAKYADSEWMVILNDDIEFEIQNSKLKTQNYNLNLKTIKKNIFEELINFAQKNKLDAVSPILVNPNGQVENVGYKVLPYGKIKLVKELTGLRVNELRKTQNSNLKSQIKNLKLKTNNSNTNINKIDGITAACLLIKTEVFKKLGGFDESFFAYLEDVDLFLRLKKAGYKFALVPDIVVFHHHRKTSLKMGCFKQRQDVVNWWRLFFKHPDIIRLSPAFLIERAKNVWGLMKCLTSNI